MLINTCLRRFGRRLLVAVISLSAALVSAASPVFVGLDAEFGNKTSTADDAIRVGMEMAIEDINRAGGVLGGRPLELVIRDNRGVPARGIDNLQELAALPDLTALVTSKFSPVVLAQLNDAHRLRLPVLAAWSAADNIIDHNHKPSFTFRLSLRDSWVMPRLLQEAARRGLRKIGLLVPDGAWGRSNIQAAENYATQHPVPAIIGHKIYEWSDPSLGNEYLELIHAGAEAILFVGNEPEIARLAVDIATLDPEHRRPILAHWGITGGDPLALAGPAFLGLDLVTVQTFSFIDNPAPRAERILQRALKKLSVSEARQIHSPVGIAHGYDLVHLLARAIDKAGSTDRARIRDKLERLEPHDGLVRQYRPAFTPTQHEALGPENIFLARWRKDGTLAPVR